MKKLLLLIVAGFACVSSIQGQTSGNIAYSERTRNRQRDTSFTAGTVSTDDGGVFIDAYVLLNSKAEEYVAIFSASQEGSTVQECSQKLSGQIQDFTNELKAIGVQSDDVDVDFIVQNRVYDYEVNSDAATEKLSGFEIKKNISVHYKEKNLLDRLMAAAAKVNIYDLIKVDYVVKDVSPIREKLLEEGSKIIKEKEARYEKLFGLKFRSQIQVVSEKYDAVFPKDSYASYTAYESGQVNANYYSQRYRIVQARKNATFFFNGTDPGQFDYVINPVVNEPVVQFTMYLRVKRVIDR